MGLVLFLSMLIVLVILMWVVEDEERARPPNLELLRHLGVDDEVARAVPSNERFVHTYRDAFEVAIEDFRDTAHFYKLDLRARLPRLSPELRVEARREDFVFKRVKGRDVALATIVRADSPLTLAVGAGEPALIEGGIVDLLEALTGAPRELLMAFFSAHHGESLVLERGAPAGQALTVRLHVHWRSTGRLSERLELFAELCEAMRASMDALDIEPTVEGAIDRFIPEKQAAARALARWRPLTPRAEWIAGAHGVLLCELFEPDVLDAHRDEVTLGQIVEAVCSDRRALSAPTPAQAWCREELGRRLEPAALLDEEHAMWAPASRGELSPTQILPTAMLALLQAYEPTAALDAPFARVITRCAPSDCALILEALERHPHDDWRDVLGAVATLEIDGALRWPVLALTGAWNRNHTDGVSELDARVARAMFAAILRAPASEVASVIDMLTERAPAALIPHVHAATVSARGDVNVATARELLAALVDRYGSGLAAGALTLAQGSGGELSLAGERGALTPADEG